MAKQRLELEGKNEDINVGTMFGLQITALKLIEELAKARPDPVYLEQIRQTVRTSLEQAQAAEGWPEASPEARMNALKVADFIFDHVRFER